MSNVEPTHGPSAGLPCERFRPTVSVKGFSRGQASPTPPSRLPSFLTIDPLHRPHGSVPHNPLLTEPLYQTQYIERMGTGTGAICQHDPALP